MSYDVFISFKNSGRDGKSTPDASAARQIYGALRDLGLKVFFSEESLVEVGKGQFGKSIEMALESARVLILVASCREHIESPWVESEWDSFLQSVRSGHKDGELFIFNCGELKLAEMPLFLRRQQMFAKDSVDKLIQFVVNAAPKAPKLSDFIEVSLHCLRPEKKEDKVYFVTVHPGTSGDAFHVTAHWGARSAKRLSSQLKAINVSRQTASVEVEKSMQDKLRGGYRPAEFDQLLTGEARSHLAASLGVFEKTEEDPRQSRKLLPTQDSTQTSTRRPGGNSSIAKAGKKSHSQFEHGPKKQGAVKVRESKVGTEVRAARKTEKRKPSPNDSAANNDSSMRLSVIESQSKKELVSNMPGLVVAGPERAQGDRINVKHKVNPKTRTTEVRLFEFVDAMSSKYWEVSIIDKGLVIRFGKSGTNGQTQRKEFASVFEASKQADKLISEKLRKGYREVKSTPATRKPRVKGTPSTAVLRGGGTGVATLEVSKICISGKLPSGRKKADYETKLLACGYRLVDDVVRDLKYLVLSDPGVSTAKSQKARDLGVEVISEDRLIQLLK